METAGSFEAKTHFSRRLDRVAPGEEIAIPERSAEGQAGHWATSTGRAPAARRRPDGGRAGRPGDGDGLTAGPGCAVDRKLTRMVSAGGGGEYEWRHRASGP